MGGGGAGGGGCKSKTFGKKNYCTVCEEQFGDEYQFESHLLNDACTQKVVTVKKPEELKCGTCGKDYTGNKNGFEAHLKSTKHKNT